MKREQIQLQVSFLYRKKQAWSNATLIDKCNPLELSAKVSPH